MTDNRNRESVDVAIVGSGFAGLAAAVEARLAGCSVLVLEKMKGYGGNSVISDGVMAAAGTPEQQAAGIQDSPELMYEDMLKAGLGLNHPDLVRTVVYGAAEAFLWSKEVIGVKYLDRVDQFGGHSVPRCYTPTNLSGSGIVKPLLAKARALGVEIRTQASMEKLLADGSGRIIGVEVRQGYNYSDPSSGNNHVIEARRGVVLAAGGFANDVEFRCAQDPRLTVEVDSTNKPCTTAEALREALRIGAAPVQLSRIQLGPWTSPDEKMFGAGPDFASYVGFPYGLAVNPETGRRFVNELADRQIRAEAILNVGHPCVVLADSHGVELAGRHPDRAMKKGVVKSFSDLDDLARHYGLPTETFRETVERFNQAVSSGRDEDFGKPILAGARPLARPPYYAMRLWPKVHHTMGGVRIDTEARVLDLKGRPITGLYAAGEFTGGVHGACRLGSCAIPDCLVFGRLAGRNAAGHPASK